MVLHGLQTLQRQHDLWLPDFQDQDPPSRCRFKWSTSWTGCSLQPLCFHQKNMGRAQFWGGSSVAMDARTVNPPKCPILGSRWGEHTHHTSKQALLPGKAHKISSTGESSQSFPSLFPSTHLHMFLIHLIPIRAFASLALALERGRLVCTKADVSVVGTSALQLDSGL